MATFEDDARILRDHLEVIHRLNTAIVEALLRVAKETNTPPAELAQMVGMGGGGIHNLFQPLITRHAEERQRQFLEAQRSARRPPDEE